MVVDKQVEYDMRNYISNLNDKALEREFAILLRDFNMFSKFELLCYSLISIENGFQKDSFIQGSMHQNAANKRTILEWFQKKLLNTKIRKNKFEFNQYKYDKFEESLPIILKLCGNYILNEKFKQKRGINKILIEVDEKNEYYFKNPIIKDKIDCQDTYYWEKNIDNSELQLEIQIKNETTKKIINKYFFGNSDLSINEFLTADKIDKEIYDSCKKNVQVDIDKIGCEFCSNIFNNKEQLISILGLFMYLSRTYMLKNEMESRKTPVIFKKPIIIKKQKLIEIINKFMDIESNQINCIIDYLSINYNCQWGINEYQLINIDECILWIPSSFIMNDFQFSIVNGHYEKKIDIIKRDDTVSQSVVDNIVNECKKYKNIVISSNKEYFDKQNTFNNKELKSDVDVALYDTISNTLIIIECKWKEKLFLKGEKYDKICDDVSKIYKNQLDKHKYFLQLDTNNLDFIFENDERVKKRPYYPQVQYIMVDKRIQLHYYQKHTLSEFNFLKVIKDNSINNILKLDNVISYINTLKTEVEYSIGKSKSILEYSDKRINNSLFSLI